jgi:hypothetical protein
VGLSECSGSAPLRDSRPQRCVGATALETADARAHGHAHAAALANAPLPRPAACDPARAEARANRGVGERTSHCGMREVERATDLDTKKPGVHAAPPGESLFSSLFSVAARGGKSPRVSVVTCSLGRATRVVKSRRRRTCRLLRARHANAPPYMLAWVVPVDPVRASPAVTMGRLLEVVGGVAAGPGGTYIVDHLCRRAVAQFPTRRHHRPTCPNGDITVTTRPGLVVFSRATFSLSPCSARSSSELRAAPLTAPDFTKEAHS